MPGCTGCPWKPEQRHKSAGEIALLREIVAPIPHDRQSCATARTPRGLRRHIRRSLKWRPHAAAATAEEHCSAAAGFPSQGRPNWVPAYTGWQTDDPRTVARIVQGHAAAGFDPASLGGHDLAKP